MKEYSVIGKRLPRLDSNLKVTGEAIFTGDMKLPGMLYGKILRSPYPHAKILNIDASKALKLPGVKAIVTGKDTAGIKYGCIDVPQYPADKYPLAIDKVRYIGDDVAAVAAIDEDIAEEALELIKVDYEVLPAVFDPEEAMESCAPKIHDHRENNIGVMTEMNIGDIDKGFKESYYIREDKFINQTVTHCSIESHAALASFDSLGKLTIWSSTQSPYIVNEGLAMTLGLPGSRIRVIKPYVGGAFGGKIEFFALDFCASLLSQKTSRPVKIIYTREEVFIATHGRHSVIMELKTGVKKDGNLSALKARFIADGGAYIGGNGAFITFLNGFFLTLPYRIKNMEYRGYRVYTNKPVRGSFRGYGALSPRFAFESQLDIIANEIGIDPVDLRLKNALQVNEELPNGFKIASCGFSKCIKNACEDIGWKEKKCKREENKGLGIAGGGYIAGGLFYPVKSSAAFIKLHHDGAITLITGASDTGQGANTILCQIAAEELGLKIENIKIQAADTEITPIDPGTFWTTFLAGNAVKLAAADVKKQLLNIASEKLEANIEDLEIRDEKVCVKGCPEIGISIAEVISTSIRSPEGNPILGKGYYSLDLVPPNLATGEGNLSMAYSFGTTIAELEVDLDTGKVKINNIISTIDCGEAINPMAVEGQIEGCIASGLGYALWENLYRDRGQTMNPSFLGYKIPTSLEMPKTKSVIIESIEPQGPFGAKEAGQIPHASIAPAIANAIYNAIGIRIKDLPITPEKILRGLEEGIIQQ